MTAQTEELLGGCYRSASRIAAGGMGRVCRARDEVLGRPVAVKVLRPEYADDQAFAARFLAEARNTAALTHPGIAQVYDFGEAQLGARPSSATVAYVVMELVPGEPLSAIIAREGVPQGRHPGDGRELYELTTIPSSEVRLGVCRRSISRLDWMGSTFSILFRVLTFSLSR